MLIGVAELKRIHVLPPSSRFDDVKRRVDWRKSSERNIKENRATSFQPLVVDFMKGLPMSSKDLGSLVAGLYKRWFFPKMPSLSARRK
jgi:hypothetical protein